MLLKDKVAVIHGAGGAIGSAVARTFVLTSRAAARHMVQRRSGVVLTLSASPAQLAIALTGGFGVACAAIEGLTRTLAAELGLHGIRVVCLRSHRIGDTLGSSPDFPGVGREVRTLSKGVSISERSVRQGHRGDEVAEERKRRRTMRFMVIVKASKESEAGQMPSEKILTDMGRFNEELVKAGVMLAGEGLHPSSKGKRVRFSGGDRTVIDGPFAETKELVAGFWLWQVKSMDEAVEWLKRAPFDGGTEVEIRPVFEADDFGKEFTPELRAQEERLRAQIGAKR